MKEGAPYAFIVYELYHHVLPKIKYQDDKIPPDQNKNIEAVYILIVPLMPDRSPPHRRDIYSIFILFISLTTASSSACLPGPPSKCSRTP